MRWLTSATGSQKSRSALQGLGPIRNSTRKSVQKCSSYPLNLSSTDRSEDLRWVLNDQTPLPATQNCTSVTWVCLTENARQPGEDSRKGFSPLGGTSYFPKNLPALVFFDSLGDNFFKEIWVQRTELCFIEPPPCSQHCAECLACVDL